MGAAVVLAVAVFAVLPRWNVPPVVTTEQALPPGPARPLPSLAAEPRPTPRLSSEPREATAGRPAPIRRSATPDAPSVAPPASSDFDAAVSDGLAALERAAPEEARAAFARAETLRPGSAVVKDGLERADAVLRVRALDGHRDRARAAESAEDWRAALREYEAALRIEPSVRFAVEGVARASLRADVADRLDAYLRRPDRLSTPAVADEAEIALDRASEIPSPGPRLRRQIEELRGHLAGAGVPVAVRLISDDRTEVTVLRVGPQGRFREKSLELRPGSYVVVGTRPGYRDARHTLVVPPGRSPAPLTVRCDEAL